MSCPYHGVAGHRENHEQATLRCPFRLVVPSLRTFLKTTFTETPGSTARENEPRALVHPTDAERLGIDEGILVKLGNDRGEIQGVV